MLSETDGSRAAADDMMRCMVLDAARTPLRLASLPVPTPGPGQVLIRVHACAVCRTDLHVVDAELTEPKLPLIPGHEIVGTVAALGEGVERYAVGDRVGVPWLGWTCDVCEFCRSGRENLCAQARFTGYQIDGGYGEFTVADQRFCFAIPDGYSDIDAAPLLCAGLIGYRSLRMAGEARRLGLYGFGAAAHIIAQVARWQGRQVFAFTSPGDIEAQQFAHDLGAVWAGGSDQPAPEMLDAAIIFAPVGSLVPAALRSVERGGTVVCAGIHMSPIPGFPYDILWGERVVRSVANLTRADGDEFLAVAPKVPVKTHTLPYQIDQANQALDDLRAGRLQGAAVLMP
jgi:propanol-preferring alcohol dehydrogenase